MEKAEEEELWRKTSEWTGIHSMELSSVVRRYVSPINMYLPPYPMKNNTNILYIDQYITRPANIVHK